MKYKQKCYSIKIKKNFGSKPDLSYGGDRKKKGAESLSNRTRCQNRLFQLLQPTPAEVENAT